jgi:glycosyltransferase involved in cell wall biosynthesis
MSNLFLSIIIPSFNQGRFIQTCLNSIIKQNFKNYEVIICDNCSTDKTKSILKKYKKYKNFRVYIKKDAGQADAINFGLKKAKGIFVTWQNCDDFYYPNAFQNFFKTYVKNKKKSDCIFGNIDLINYNNIKKTNLKFCRVNFFHLISEGMVITNQSAIWRKHVHQKIGYLKNYNNCFDYEWFLRLAFNKYRFKKINFKKSIAAFRIYKSQKSSNYSLEDYNRYNKIIRKYQSKSIYKMFNLKILSILSRFIRMFFFILDLEIIYVLHYVKKLFLGFKYIN